MEPDTSIAGEHRSKPRTIVLAVALVPGFIFGITNLVQTVPSGTALWVEISARLVGVLLVAVSGNAAWQLARSRSVRFSFTVYALVMIALIVLAFVLVANGGS